MTILKRAELLDNSADWPTLRAFLVNFCSRYRYVSLSAYFSYSIRVVLLRVPHIPTVVHSVIHGVYFICASSVAVYVCVHFCRSSV